MNAIANPVNGLMVYCTDCTHPVTGATGYKWNTVNDTAGATGATTETPSSNCTLPACLILIQVG